MDIPNELAASLIELIKDSSKAVYNSREAAYALGMSVTSLNTLAKSGNGPRFSTNGKTRLYTKKDLFEWAESLPTYKSWDEFYESHPEARPNDKGFTKFATSLKEHNLSVAPGLQ